MTQTLLYSTFMCAGFFSDRPQQETCWLYLWIDIEN